MTRLFIISLFAVSCNMPPIGMDTRKTEPASSPSCEHRYCGKRMKDGRACVTCGAGNKVGTYYCVNNCDDCVEKR